MFAKLKKKIAEEAATTSRAGGAARMPRSISKESITSVGADSGDDFPSDGSSSREDLSSQLFRRNEQIRKLEVKLSDYAEQVRNLQKIKEKLEHALETHQDSFVKKLQEQNEAHQASAAKMAEGVALALEKKDQEWKEKLSHLEKERDVLSAQLQERTEQSLILFQKRDELDELEGFQQQELAKVKHMLLKKEESLALAQQELASSAEELARAREAARVSQAASSRLSGELQEFKRQHADLRAERDELLEAEESAENKITTLERRAQELQTFIQRLSADLQHAQVTASDCKKRLETLQGDHESLKAEYERHKQKAVLEAEEKARLVGLLQDKVATLEKRFEGNLSGDDHVRQLLREKSTLEERLEEARRQLSAARSSHAESVGLLETQIDRLSGQLAEGQARLSEQEELVRGLRESRAQQQKDLERALRLADDVAAKSKEEVEGRDRQIQKLQTELELERTRLQEGLSVAERRWAEQVRRLEEQGAGLEAARESERAAVQRERGRAERENEELRARCDVLESSLKSRGVEVERLMADLSSATERAKHLEEEQKQKEALQRQVADLTSSLKEKDALIAEKTDLLLKEEEALSHLRQGYEALLLQRCQLQSSLERCQHQAAKREAVAEGQRSTWRAQLREAQERLVASEEHAAALELASAASRKHSRPPEEGEGEPNGEVAATDVVQIQKENRDLEQQLAEKNKIIRQLQQRMAELKKTLQKELKIRPDGELLEVPGATLTVTNNSDLNDSREINFEYLKHVVLKFMSCRESEAFHLIKAVSVLLNFSKEEENMLKETLEYKMSWFGSKPPPRGSIRPSISSPRTAWS